MLCSSTHFFFFWMMCPLFPIYWQYMSHSSINDYYYSVWQWKYAFSSRRPSHPHPQIILSVLNARNHHSFPQITIFIFCNARCHLSYPCAGHIMLVHRSTSLLQNIAVLRMAVSHNLEGPNFKSRDQLSLVGVHYFTQSLKHLPG
jgi:hypothetical protein